MSEYYFKIPYAIRTWYPGVAPGKWREAIFNDATESGTRLLFERLPPNALGQRLALHGDLFYVQVGRDKDRRDSLYVFRIEPAENNLPRSTPIAVPCRMSLWPGGDPEFRDSVQTLFGDSVASGFTPSKEDDESSTEEDQRDQAQPSPLLLSVVAQAPADVCRRFRPSAQSNEPADALAFIDSLASMWRRRRIDQFVSATLRQESLLNRVMTPSILGRKERDGLISLFGFDALNKAVLQHRSDPERFFLLLDDFGRASLSSAMRATLWTVILSGRSSTALRQELFAVAAVDGLRQLAFDGIPAEKAWEDGLLRAMKEVAAKHDDPGLRQAADAAEASEDPVGHIAHWASQLGFSREPEEVVPGGGLEVESPAVATVPMVERVSHPADDWAFRTAGPEPATVDRIRLRLAALAREIPTQAEPIADMTSVVKLLTVLNELRVVLPGWMAELPESDTVSRDLSLAQQVYSRLQLLVPAVAASLIEKATPADVNEICDLLERQSVIREAPEWLWAPPESSQTYSGATFCIEELAQELVNPIRRHIVRTVVSMVDQLGDVSTLKWLDPPTPGSSAEVHVNVWFERTRELLSTAPPDVLDWMRSSMRSSEDVAAYTRGTTILEQTKGRLDHAVAVEVDAYLLTIKSLPERQPWIHAFVAAVDSYAEQFGDPGGVTFQALQNKAEKELKTPSSRGDTDSASARVSIDHNWTETSATKATLVFHQPEPSVDYGILSAPVVLETRRPRQLDLRLAIEVRGDLRAGWPKEWPDVEPSGPFTVPAYGWQSQPDADLWHFPVTLRIPVRKPRTEALRLEVSLQALEAHKPGALGPSSLLRWESIALRMPALELKWAGTTNPEYVRTHPIGPQAQADDIKGRLKAGGSVAVIAPRRFGKSTLVEYVLNAGPDERLLIPPAIVCTDYSTPGGLDFDRLWNDVSNWLYTNLGASLPPGLSGALPDARAFDLVRSAAHSKGFSAVVLLFDEAQLFFPQNGGADLGTRLKNLLERHWSRSDDLALAPLLVGLIGLPTLRERAGADLMALLGPIERSVISEADLRRLIGSMANGLQTTRAARARLADMAGNLFILRVLLDRLVSRIRSMNRVWANSDDVFAIESELKKDLLAGREEDVARYIRDALNGAEKVTDWDPIPAFGVAAAVAEVRQQERVSGDSIRRVNEQLNQWCRLNAPDDNVRAVYSIDIVARHLLQLRERRVLKDLEFSSSLLEAWLQGVARNGAYEGFQASLLRGAQRRIHVPPGAEQVAHGAQAEIWRAATPEGKGQIAFRVRRLSTPTEEEAFQSSIEMFDALRAGILRREPGSDFLFDVIEIGLAADDSTKAVMVYRWIDGHDLSSRQGELPGDIIVDLGTKLARALSLIHSRSILHRDIRPANIVLDETLMRPVLIDFGFARRVGSDMHTRLAGDFCAPEVRRDLPAWTKAADVYSLAATLKSLLRPADSRSKDLVEVLGRALADRPEDRPNAEVLLERLEALERDHQLDQKRQDAWLRVRSAMDHDKHKPWFSAVANKFRPHFEAMSLGLYQTPMQRYRETADFLNQVLEAYPNGGLTLKRLASRDSAPESVSALVVIRNSDVHAGQVLNRDAREVLQRFQSSSSDVQRACVVDGIQRVASELQLSSLVGLLQPFVD